MYHDRRTDGNGGADGHGNAIADAADGAYTDAGTSPEQQAALPVMWEVTSIVMQSQHEFLTTCNTS